MWVGGWSAGEVQRLAAGGGVDAPGHAVLNSAMGSFRAPPVSTPSPPSSPRPPCCGQAGYCGVAQRRGRLQLPPSTDSHSSVPPPSCPPAVMYKGSPWVVHSTVRPATLQCGMVMQGKGGVRGRSEGGREGGEARGVE